MRAHLGILPASPGTRKDALLALLVFFADQKDS